VSVASFSIYWQLTTGYWLLFQRFGLVNEHDGNVVLDFVNQAAVVTDEAVALLIQADVPLALGAGQDFQEFFADGHGSSEMGWVIYLIKKSNHRAIICHSERSEESLFFYAAEILPFAALRSE
jgi:hypothetical protein